MSMYVPPSTRGQWQSNAYNIFVPRSQSYMAERARERVLTALDELQAHYRTPHADPDAKPQNYSVHSPQVGESVVHWYSFSNPRTKCIHCDNCLEIMRIPVHGRMLSHC